MPQLGLTTSDILIRLVLSVILAGAIGYDREFHDHPSGIRTHIIVCLGACILTMIQIQATFYAGWLKDIHSYGGVVLRMDPTRIVAQIVSGIGFLGAGTIIVTKRSVTGLSTAASIWAVAGIGIAIGYGFYRIAIFGTIFVYIVLVFLLKIIRIRTLKQVKVTFNQREETKKAVNQLFEKMNITVKSTNFNMDSSPDGRIYTYLYTIDIPKGLDTESILEELSTNPDIVSVDLITL